MMARERRDISAFVFLFPFTRRSSGGMIPKIESCLEALRAGVRKVHLVDGRLSHSLLLEMFTTKGVGTQIVK